MPTSFSDSSWLEERTKIPDLQDLRRRHEIFRSLDVKGLHADAVHQLFHQYYHLFPLAGIHLSDTDLNRSGIYRARWIDPRDEQVDLPAAHSYPPKEHCTMGRANLPGRPVLYASERPSTALFEIMAGRKSSSQELFISKWRLDSGRYLLFPVLPGSDTQGRSLEVHEQWMKGFRELHTRMRTGKEQELVFLLECLSELFLEDKYEVTSWVADRVLYADREIRHDMVAYPSIARLKRSVCFAVHPRLVDERALTLVRVVRLSMANYAFTLQEGLEMEGLTLRIGTPVNGVIAWSDVNDLEQLHADFPDLMVKFGLKS